MFYHSTSFLYHTNQEKLIFNLFCVIEMFFV
jgi:hypothetical protein